MLLVRALPMHIRPQSAVEVRLAASRRGAVHPTCRPQRTDDEIRAALRAAARLMRARLDGAPARHRVYRRKNRMCPRCGDVIRSWPLGDAARMAYWCPGCQRGEGPAAE